MFQVQGLNLLYLQKQQQQKKTKMKKTLLSKEQKNYIQISHTFSPNMLCPEHGNPLAAEFLR